VDNPNFLSPDEELQYQQLAQLRFWKARQEKVQTETPDNQVSKTAIPSRWELIHGITLHQWQEQCVEAWIKAGGKGVIKVVTGAGKTVLAMAIAERLQQTRLTELRIAVVVPTVVLLEQWKAEFIERSNLPAEAIGLVGGGHDEIFNDKIRVLISVLNSASKKLPALVRDAGVGDSLLLIVDECHRAGAAEMQKIFQTQRAFSLGLSATPERDTDPSDDDSEQSAVALWRGPRGSVR
jgi:superfamily II DNA or RNA helicase